jgi:opacity protein-like surface antigen
MRKIVLKSMLLAAAVAFAAPIFADEEAAAEKTIEERVSDLEKKFEEKVGHPLGLNYGGYVDTSYTAVFRGDARAAGMTPMRVFDRDPEGFNIHAAKLWLERPLTAENGWDAGFRVDLLFGDDAKVTQAAGLDLGTSGDLIQAFVQMRAPIGNGLDIKIGKFVTLMGAEVIESPANWNFSRSYLFGFGIPFTHLGVSARYPITENMDAELMIIEGWDVVDDNNNSKSLMGRVGFTSLDGKLSLNLVGHVGPENMLNNHDKRYVFDGVAKYAVTEKLAVMLDALYGYDELGSANWYGIAGYANYKINDKLSGTVRAEWFADPDGFRTGATSDYYEITATLDYNPVWKLHIRPEYRFDGSADPTALGVGGGRGDSQHTVALNVYFEF